MKTIVNVVAAKKGFKFGGELKSVPPSKEAGRAKNYMWPLHATAAANLVRAGLIQPAFKDDAFAIRKAGADCHPFYEGYDSKVEDAPKPSPKEKEPKAPALKPVERTEEAEVNLEDLVLDALKSGKRKDLEQALKAAGVDHSDMKSNTEREEALKAL